MKFDKWYWDDAECCVISLDEIKEGYLSHEWYMQYSFPEYFSIVTVFDHESGKFYGAIMTLKEAEEKYLNIARNVLEEFKYECIPMDSIDYLEDLYESINVGAMLDWQNDYEEKFNKAMDIVKEIRNLMEK